MDNNPFVSVRLPVSGITLNFYTPQEFIEESRKEIQRWNWLTKAVSGNSPESLRKTVLKPLTDFKTKIDEMISSTGGPPSLENASAYSTKGDKISRFLTDLYNERFPHSTEAHGLLVLKTQDVSTTEALGMLAFFMNKPFANDADIFRGYLRALLSAAPELFRQEEYRETLQSMILNLNNHIGETERQSKKSIQDLSETVKSLMTLHEHHEAQVKKNEDDFRQMLNNSEKTYNERLALKAPVRYWKEKKTIHSKKAELWGWISIISAFISTLAAAGYAWYFQIHTKSIVDTLNSPPLIVLIFVLTLLIWILRIFIRVWLSHLHLMEDAQQRRVMALTYLALINEQKMDVKEDRAIILTRLFSDVSAGLIKEDSGPSSVLDMVQMLLPKSKSGQ